MTCQGSQSESVVGLAFEDRLDSWFFSLGSKLSYSFPYSVEEDGYVGLSPRKEKEDEDSSPESWRQCGRRCERGGQSARQCKGPEVTSCWSAEERPHRRRQFRCALEDGRQRVSCLTA